RWHRNAARHAGTRSTACVAAGGRRLVCKRQTLRRCRREGLAVCEGPSAGGNSTTVTVPLLAPTSLKATAKSAGEIDLNWHDTNSQEVGYLIERSFDPANGQIGLSLERFDGRRLARRGARRVSGGVFLNQTRTELNATVTTT